MKRARVEEFAPTFFSQFPDEENTVRLLLDNGRVPDNVLDSLLIDPYVEYSSFSSANYNQGLANIAPGQRPNQSSMIFPPDKTLIRIQELQTLLGTGWNWNNVVIAGGYALWMIGAINSTRDIDMFIYGLNPALAEQKIKEIIGYFQTNLTKEGYNVITRTDKSITFYNDYSDQPFQLILRNYHHPAEILLGFDLPCVRVCFDGNWFWMLRSAQFAIVNRCNTATGYQPFRTGTYEYRLVKYLNRGYGIRVPDFQPERIDHSIYIEIKNASELTGLARLLYMVRKNELTYLSPSTIGDYDPLRELSYYIKAILDDSTNPKIIRDIINDMYTANQNFMIELRPENWHRLFDGTWDIRNFIPDHSGEIPEFGKHPIKIIGSLLEYLQSLPAPNAWYCQAYGIPGPEC